MRISIEIQPHLNAPGWYIWEVDLGYRNVAKGAAYGLDSVWADAEKAAKIVYNLAEDEAKADASESEAPQTTPPTEPVPAEEINF